MSALSKPRKRKAAPAVNLPADPLSLLWPRQMSIETAARYIDATPWAVEELCRSGRIVAYKQGRAWAMDRLELDRHVARRHAEAAARLAH